MTIGHPFQLYNVLDYLSMYYKHLKTLSRGMYATTTVIIPRLSQVLWTTTPTTFNHPYHLSTRFVVESFNS